MGRVAVESTVCVALALDRPSEPTLITLAGSPCSDSSLEGRQ